MNTDGLETVEALRAKGAKRGSFSLSDGQRRLLGRRLLSFAGDEPVATARMKFWPGMIARYAPLFTLLMAYFFLTVLMNLAFVLYDGRLASGSIEDFSIEAFPVRTLGYWLLLFLPFLIVPPVAIFSRHVLEQRVRNLAKSLPEFQLRDYLVI